MSLKAYNDLLRKYLANREYLTTAEQDVYLDELDTLWLSLSKDEIDEWNKVPKHE